MSKYIESGGDWNQVDFFDITVSTFNPFRKMPGGNYATELLNSAVDFKGGKFRTILSGKSAKDFFLDATMGAAKAHFKNRFQINYGENNLRSSGIDFMGAGAKTILKSITP